MLHSVTDDDTRPTASGDYLRGLADGIDQEQARRDDQAEATRRTIWIAAGVATALTVAFLTVAICVATWIVVDTATSLTHTLIETRPAEWYGSTKGP